MSLFDPSQGRPAIHHGGSFNANPLSMVAGAATLEQLDLEDYETLSNRGELLRDNLTGLFAEMGHPAQITGLGSLFGVHLTDQPVHSYRDAQAGDRELRHQIFLGMLNEGIVMDPRGAGCLSTVIGTSEIDIFVDSLRRVLGAKVGA
jgi:glutamate-1-semialdehyde 2,1-aminomutase